MSIPYRTRRTLNRLGIFALIVIIIGGITWICWVVWLQRYVVYVDGGAMLDFEHSANDAVGELATPPKAAENISIYYNEGADAIDAGAELTKLSGYYITSEMFQKDYDNISLQVERLPAGTAVMIDMKGPYGSFFYQSKLGEALISQGTNIDQVTALVKKMKDKGFYTIARISAFRDYNFGNNHVTSGLYMLSRAGLWMDPEGYFWLDPTMATVTNWVSSIVLELRDMGFNEVLLGDFCFPDSDKYIFEGDKAEALQKAANTLMSSCSSSKFTLSFLVKDPTFPLPDGRCRMYLDGVDAMSVGAKAAQVTIDDKENRLVFLTESGDTRFDDYGVLRSMNVAEEVEARKEMLQ